ncbi:MAG: glycerate kinase [Anaerolineales bacterium]|nr:glycerate kinase [Anaerolineales bacterium]
MITFNPEVLKSGQVRERRERALAVLSAALEAVDPANAIKRQVSLSDDSLRIGQRVYDLGRYRNIYVIGGGKAGGSMAKAIEEILGQRVTAGLVNVKYGHGAETAIIRLNEAGHPIPDAAGMAGTKQMAELARQATEDDLVLCLISGGGSALMTLPVEGITLADVKSLTDAFLRCGATINEINAVRKHLSQIKGGNLARLAYPAEIVSLILSDVVGSPLDVIASGPTVPDTTTFADAYGVIEKYGLLEELPRPIVEHLQQGKEGLIPETPKEGAETFARTYNLIIASNEVAAEAATARAEELGFHTLLLSTFVEGEAREVARVFAAIAKEIINSGRPVSRPACVVAGGETTVTIRGHGLGGRNQEMALSAALEIAGLEDVMIIPLATDGTDGPTDAAGAIADGSTLRRAQEAGLPATQYLADNDSYHFFQQLGDLLISGPTNTNVNDLTFTFVF